MAFHIIHAERHPAVRLGIETVLAAKYPGTTITGCSSFVEVRDALADSPCDAVILDIWIPHGVTDGERLLHVTTIARQISPPVIVFGTLTTSDGGREIDAITRSGVLGLVHKEARTSEVAVAIRHVLAKRHYLCRHLQNAMLESGRSLEGSYKDTPLSLREREVLRLIGKGMRLTEIASHLHRTPSTISRQKFDAKRKLGISNDADLFRWIGAHIAS